MQFVFDCWEIKEDKLEVLRIKNKNLQNKLLGKQ